jgi:hypothetical protein
MSRTIRKLFLILVVGMVLPYVGKAQQNKQLHPIRLKSGNIIPAINVATWADSMINAGALAQPVQTMIHFASMPTSEEKATLAENGITLLDYIPDNTFTAIITKQLNKAKTSSGAILSIINTQPEWKADEYLWKKAATNNGSIDVVISVYSGTSEEQVKEFIRSLGGQLKPGTMKPYGCYNIIIEAAKLRNLAGWYAVRFISPATEMRALDRQSIPAVKGNIGISPSLWGGYGLNGDSVTVGVGDNTSGVFHTDVTDRVLNFNPAPPTNHGIHINCIVGGAAILDPLAMSMTPKVSLIDFFFSNVLAATGQMLQDHNMTITNNSYTVVEDDCDYFGTYDLYSRYLDTLALQYPTVQHVFAAGNDGELTCPPHAPGYGTMGGGYQPSKNTLVVGSVSNNLEPAWDQSKGPVRDGRLKPEIVAVGASVYSGIQNNGYKWAGGTSMASPQAASGLAILTQRYKQTHAGTQPRADLIKTILINTAMDLGTPGPDFNYGYGMMDIGRALKAMDGNQYHTADISTNDSQSYTISIPAGIARAKIMLCWNDIPASPSASKQLVNDLDLSVTTPGSTRHLPLTLDGSTANELNIAIERPDHLNNTEQVTIENPTAGNYTISVNGFNIPFGPQHYVITYDLIPKAVQLTYPLGGEQISNTDSLRIFWNAVADGNTFNVAYSTDNGGNWTTISDNVAASAHYIGILPSGINSGICKVRIRRNGTSEEVTSGVFAISTRPTPVLSESQCPGYVNIHWSPLPNVTNYEMLKKVGAEMKVVATVADTSYSFSGMALDAASIVAVQPVVDGLKGYRSLAIVTRANYGDCANPISKGDLLVERIAAPASGRLLTSTAPGSSSTIGVVVRNLYTLNCSNYILSYKINSSAWQTLVNPGTVIPANGSAVIDIPGYSFATPGNYDITVAIKNTAISDPQSQNDTIRYTVKCLPNDPLDLTTEFKDDFETMGKFSVSHDSIGISSNGHWDYFNDDDSGRIRSYVFEDITIGGNRSISLDQFMPMKHGSKNIFAGTFNLADYDTAMHEVRVDFDYLLHGNPATATGNIVSARGNDLSPWKPFYNYDLSAYPGYVKRVLSLSLTDALRFGGNNFSTSTQVAFGQSDTSIIADKNYGNGITLDNFRMYTVANDAMVAGIVSPEANNCGLPSSVPLTVKVRNGVNYTLHNVSLFYTIDGGTVYTGSLDSIRAKDSVNFTFAQPLNVGSGATHELNVWLTASGDTYALNDSLLHYKFRNSKIITSYPYLENFEANDGGFYDGGFMSSWQYGTPAAAHINKAASGTKAWKSNLTGKYNNLENSYLYSPCYDISQLSNPTLSFSMAQDLENCGNVLCDGAYLEYSFDGTIWNKLGAPGQGYNWYDSSFVIWNTIGFTRWHVATIGLPQPPAGKVLHLRFVLFSDPAVAFEGLAIDDIHIYDLIHTIQPTKDISSADMPVSNQWNDYVVNGKLVASVQPNTNTGNTKVSLFGHDTLSNPGKTQYVFPRSYTINTELSQDKPFKLRLFLNDSDLLAVLNDTACPSCTPLTDAYSLGITQFYTTDGVSAANGSMADNLNGVYEFHPSNSILWIPYDKGYRAELEVSRPSEYWFNNGGPTGTFPWGIDYMNFLAFRSGDKAQILWHSLIDTSALVYTLERSDSGVLFKDIYQAKSGHTNPGDYTFVDSTDFVTLPTRYYRLRWTMAGTDKVNYSPVRKVGSNDSALNLVQFDVATAGKRLIQLGWVSYIDGLADHYIVERAINGAGYETIQSPVAAHWYGKSYLYYDSPDDATAGSLIRYRLTAILTDGSKVLLPERAVRLVDENAVLSIYPNPSANGTFSIRWNAEKGMGMRVSISDITGKLMDETSATAGGWDNITALSMGYRPKGIYILRMTIGENRFTSKLVVE